MSDECARGFCYKAKAPGKLFCEHHDEVESLERVNAGLVRALEEHRRSMEYAFKVVDKFASAKDSEEELEVIHELTHWTADARSALASRSLVCPGAPAQEAERTGTCPYELVGGMKVWCSDDCWRAGVHVDVHPAPKDPR